MIQVLSTEYKLMGRSLRDREHNSTQREQQDTKRKPNDFSQHISLQRTASEVCEVPPRDILRIANML